MVITASTCAPMSPVGSAAGVPLPSAQATSGNAATPETSGITSERLNPIPAATPVTNRNGGPPSGASSTA